MPIQETVVAHNIIPLSEAYRLLQNCGGISVYNSIYAFHGLTGLTGNSNNKFLFINYSDTVTANKGACFCEGLNQNCILNGKTLTLVDYFGQVFMIKLV